MHNKIQKERGITLLVTLLLMGVLLSVSTSLLNITLKQYKLSGISLESEKAFNAAFSGLECIVYNDTNVSAPSEEEGEAEVCSDGESIFECAIKHNIRVGENPTGPQNGLRDTLECSGNSINDEHGIADIESGNEQLFEIGIGNGANTQCSSVSVLKYSSSTADINFTNPLGSGNLTCLQGVICTVVISRGYNVRCNDINSAGRVVERAYTVVY